jgi:hypothetical protein
MRQLLYVSNTDRGLSPGVMESILEVSRRNNRLLYITGMLLYIDGGFLQVLEGEERAVRDTYARICNDKRHWDTKLLLDRESPRAFVGWSMGFEHARPYDPGTASLFAITREALESRITPEAGTVILTMLETFYRVQRGESIKLAKSA